MKKLIAILLIATQSWAGFPPPSTQGQSDASSKTKAFYQSPFSQMTDLGGLKGLIETGNTNLLANPGFEDGSGAGYSHFWSASGAGSLAADTSNFHGGKQSAKATLTANTECVYQDVTPTVQMGSTNMEYGAWVKTSGTDVQVCARQAGATVGTCTAVPSTNTWQYVNVNYPGPSSGSVGVSVCNTTNNTETFNVDDAYVGQARNLSQVSQAQLIGQVKITGCNQGWSTTNASFGTWTTTPTGCSYAVTAGTSCTGGGNSYPAITCPSIAPGNLVLKYEGALQSVAGAVASAQFQFTDGTNNALEISQFGNATASSTVGGSGISQSITYSSPQSNVTFSIRGQTSSASSPASIYGTNTNPGVISVYYFPTQNQVVANPNTIQPPQTTVYLSGTSQTYTVPNGATYLEIEMVGGGGGGGGSGSPSGGTSGTASTFGTSLLSAGGGGVASGVGGGSGGTSSLGTGPTGITLSGANGQSGFQTNVTNVIPNGGQGGSSYFGGAGAGGANAVGGNAVANTGSGGGGAGSSAANAGGGGGAGGYVHAFIQNSSSAWASSFTYTVGAGGTHMTGTNNGGDGAAGLIRVTAYFSPQFPILVGGVTSSGSGQYHTEYATVTPTNGTTCTVAGGNTAWIASQTATAAGDCTLNFAANEFSAPPICTFTQNNGPNLTIVPGVNIANLTSSLVRVQETYMSNGSTTVSANTAALNVICFGPH